MAVPNVHLILWNINLQNLVSSYLWERRVCSPIWSRVRLLEQNRQWHYCSCTSLVTHLLKTNVLSVCFAVSNWKTRLPWHSTGIEIMATMMFWRAARQWPPRPVFLRVVSSMDASFFWLLLLSTPSITACAFLGGSSEWNAICNLLRLRFLWNMDSKWIDRTKDHVELDDFFWPRQYAHSVSSVSTKICSNAPNRYLCHRVLVCLEQDYEAIKGHSSSSHMIDFSDELNSTWS